jgi:chemotaxis signal transduction protein
MTDSAEEPQHSRPSTRPHASGADLARLVADVGQDPSGTLALLLHRREMVRTALDLASGTEHLLFVCADIRCALPLMALREVLPSVPHVVPLPFSPDWMLGIFPLRSEMMGIADPAPLLFGHADDAVRATHLSPPAPHGENGSPFRPGPPRTPVLVIGTEARALALAVGAVGDIARIQPAEVLSPATALSSGPMPCAEAYVAGIYRPADGGSPHIILDAERLLEDLLDALEEKDERYG